LQHVVNASKDKKRDREEAKINQWLRQKTMADKDIFNCSNVANATRVREEVREMPPTPIAMPCVDIGRCCIYGILTFWPKCQFAAFAFLGIV